MRMLPATLGNYVKSNAEKKIFGFFKALTLENDDMCFHSLRLSEHAYKIMGEIDFLLLSPSGIFVFEVKGGRVGVTDIGVWHTIDRFNITHLTKGSPIEQASSAAFSLAARLKKYFGTGKLHNLVFGFAVIFPDVDFPVSSVEWDNETIISENDCRSVVQFRAAIKRVIKYWRAKKGNPPLIDNVQVKAIRDYLRPSFDLAPTLKYVVREIAESMTALTKEQYYVVDLAEYNDRLVCVGSAGTGKTFVALELAKRKAEAGRNVGLICRSALLADRLRHMCTTPRITIGCVDTLEPGLKFDELVIDEGQDLMNFTYLETLDSIVDGGLEHGKWTFFLDPNNQAGVYGDFDDDAFELIKSYKTVIVPLKRNCRNTKKVVSEVQLITGADIGVANAGDGPEVKYHYYDTAKEGAEILETEIRSLLRNEITAGEITILSPVLIKSSIVDLMSDTGKRLIRQADANPSRSLIEYSTIRDFKGLENEFVFVTDINECVLDKNASLLYVAMTRPRTGLYMLCPRSLKKKIEALPAINIEKILKLL